jgi:hypothetical protein
MLINPYVFGKLWTPAEITTALWLDAADSSTISTVSGAVSQWNDKSGNSRHVRQATVGYRPTLSAGGFNSLNAISFNGSSGFLSSASSLTSGTYAGDLCAYWVATRNGTTGTILTERLSTQVCTSGWSQSASNYFISSDGVNSTSNHQITASSFALLGSGGGIVAHFHVSGLRDVLYVNGSQVTVTIGTATSITGSAGFRIGRREGLNTNFWNGLICELVVSLSSQTTTQRQLIEGYLAHKWGLTANLPSDHPYKSAAPTV